MHSKSFVRLVGLVSIVSLCREWLKDVPRRGVAFAANAVHRRHYAGCVDNGMVS